MKKIFKDDNEKRAAILTFLTVFILFLWMFFHTAFTYQDPPEEYGMEVNFGTTDFGNGKDQPLEEVKSEPVHDVVSEEPIQEIIEDPSEEPVEEPVEEIIEDSLEEVVEEVITEETIEDVPVITPVKEIPKEVVKEVLKEDSKEVIKKKEPPKKETTPSKSKPDQATQDALSSVLNGPPAEGATSGNEGDDDESGDKGNDNGDPNSPGYYTNPGNGSGGNYDLIGRLVLRRPEPIYSCGKEGRVVVTIRVDRTGKVIVATPGTKGSTTTDPCLLNRAQEAALKTKWQSAANAPEKQIGKIIYNFSLH
jgi:outer membrane biosynthesis protein TonB|tara:strand:+ start:488 stop:1408 length:921 start_codon:yes stop_codon:yes gene_type:complete